MPALSERARRDRERRRNSRRWNVEGAPRLRPSAPLRAGHPRSLRRARASRRPRTASASSLPRTARWSSVARRRLLRLRARPTGRLHLLKGLRRPPSPRRRRAELVGHTQPVTAVRFSPDGARVLTGSRDADAPFGTRGPEPHCIRFGVTSEPSAMRPSAPTAAGSSRGTATRCLGRGWARLFFLRGHRTSSPRSPSTRGRASSREAATVTCAPTAVTSARPAPGFGPPRPGSLTGRRLTPAERAQFWARLTGRPLLELVRLRGERAEAGLEEVVRRRRARDGVSRRPVLGATVWSRRRRLRPTSRCSGCR